jgi:hypothetical protein
MPVALPPPRRHQTSRNDAAGVADAMFRIYELTTRSNAEREDQRSKDHAGALQELSRNNQRAVRELAREQTRQLEVVERITGQFISFIGRQQAAHAESPASPPRKKKKSSRK